MCKQNNNSIEILQCNKAGFNPVVTYQSWTVGMLNFLPRMTPEGVDSMQQHRETDEVFVLLQGRCIIFYSNNDDKPDEIFAEPLQPGTVYNIKRFTWHTQIMSKDAKILIVENTDTTLENSPRVSLTDVQIRKVQSLARELGWKP